MALKDISKKKSIVNYNKEYCISTFCYGERYRNQANRLIKSFDIFDDTPEIVVVTDNPSEILRRKNVHAFNINDFNPKYSNYNTDYFTFDFSVKRYSVLAGLKIGFTKIVLTDADAIGSKWAFNHKNLMVSFRENSIDSQVTYNFFDNVHTDSMLGRRFLIYEEEFGVTFDKTLLTVMPEDCIQFLDIEENKFYKFLQTWDDCIKIKEDKNLPNIPAGNIDEMCFSALYNGINIGNSSEKIINVLYNEHDKWYYGE